MRLMMESLKLLLSNMSFRFLLPCICFCLFLTACSNKKTEEGSTVTLEFSDELRFTQCPSSELLSKKTKRILYYLDGNCAYCFGVMTGLEKLADTELNGIEIIFIADANDIDMFEWNLGKSEVKSCVWIDQDKTFEKLNPDNVYLGQIALLGVRNEILAEGNIMEDKDKLAEFKSLLN